MTMLETINKNSLPVTALYTIVLMWCWHTQSAIATESAQNITECVRIRFKETVLTTNDQQTDINYMKLKYLRSSKAAVTFK